MSIKVNLYTTNTVRSLFACFIVVLVVYRSAVAVAEVADMGEVPSLRAVMQLPLHHLPRLFRPLRPPHLRAHHRYSHRRADQNHRAAFPTSTITHKASHT